MKTKSEKRKINRRSGMKKATALLCAAAMIISFTACGKSTDYSNSTVVGKVTAINGTKVTLQLGELSESEKPEMSSGDSTQDGQTPPEMSSGDSTQDGQTPPEMPSGDGAQDGQTPPEKPSGDSTQDGQTPPEKPSTDGQQSGQTPPEKPDSNGTGTEQSASADGTGDSAGENSSQSGQTAPEMPGSPQGEAPSGGFGGMQSFTEGDETAKIDLDGATVTKNSQETSLDDISEGDVLKITFNDSNEPETVEIVSVSSGDGSSNVSQGSSANTIDENGTFNGNEYTSSGDDENALRVDGAEVTLNGITVDKSAGSSSNTENGDFYGVNAALLATNGATVTIKNAKIKSSAQNGNGVFSYGSGTTVNISDSVITTTADNSGGIQTTGGATTNAENLTVNTSGNSSAAIRSDRGGGTVNVNGGTYTSNGYNSPAVYSTAAITVSNATLTANNSEALVIEGKNSITLTDCTVTGNMSDTDGTSSDENVHNVMIYQSMSGDADVGTSNFAMTGGSLTANNGDMFYITNTACNITLSGVTVTNNDTDAYLMRICGNSASHGWGTAGSNGAQVVFTADSQTLSGNISVDTISTLNMTLKGNSVFNGTVNIVDNAQNGTAVSDNAVVTVEAGSVWNLTGNCTLTSLTNNGTINFNGYTITLADGTVLS